MITLTERKKADTGCLYQVKHSGRFVSIGKTQKMRPSLSPKTAEVAGSFQTAVICPIIELDHKPDLLE